MLAKFEKQAREADRIKKELNKLEKKIDVIKSLETGRKNRQPKRKAPEIRFFPWLHDPGPLPANGSSRSQDGTQAWCRAS